MMDIVLYAFIFWSGCVVGFILRSVFLTAFREYSGTLVVGKNGSEEPKYSFILEEQPESFMSKKEIVFKVETSGQSSNRD